MLPNVGTLLGNRWRLVKSLGEGGQAHTFHVHDVHRRLDGFVLKRLKNPSRKARFEREIDALRRLNSPQIPTVVDIGDDNGKPFMVTEYVGIDLTRACVPVDVDARLALFRQAVIGVGTAHRAGLVHRDIKPNNIVLSDGGKVNVVDFGICADTDDGAEVLTTSTEGFGNRSFAAPECEPGSAHRAVAASDVYSLGKLLYWLLSDRKLVIRERLDPSHLQVGDHHLTFYVLHLLQGTIVENPSSRWSTDELIEGVDWVRSKLDEHKRELPNRVLVDGFGPNYEYNLSASRSITTPPCGHPPSANDVGVSFMVEGRSCILDRFEFLVSKRAGSGEIQVYVSDCGPDGSPGRVVFQTHHQLATDVAWWSATDRLSHRRTIIAEHYRGAWRVAEATGAGYALKVIARDSW
ncbi:MAG: protein kinase [Acidobacteria bacterium]|nr:protein kinase [Acidobacteriota bacterium]